MPIVTLTTDFGLADHYVGAMKGVILQVAPEATLVDISHQIDPQNLYHGAVVLANAVRYFPAGTIHVAVIDPGVGTERRVLVVEASSQILLAPDNGVVSMVLQRCSPGEIRSVTEERFFRPEISATFHGRDVFAPVAGHLARGVDPADLGAAIDDPVRLDWPHPRSEPGQVEGRVLYADHFGNLVTSIDAQSIIPLGEPVHAHIGDRSCRFVRTYGDAPAGTLVALVGSCDLVEVSKVNGSALKALGAGPGTPVAVVSGDACP